MRGMMVGGGIVVRWVDVDLVILIFTWIST